MKWKAFINNIILFAALLILILLRSNVARADEVFIRGAILHFLDDPDKSKNSYQYIEDGLLTIKDGKIEKVGSFKKLQNSIPRSAKITHYQDGLIMPGFIDAHIHYPQLDMIAANSGGHLLEWLNHYTFPFEKKFKNPEYANEVANFFLDELIKNGTTSALVFATIYPNAVDALFKAAEKRQMRIITGQTLADQNLPSFLIQNRKQAFKETTALIEKWHNKPNNRLLYALTFRFAPTTSKELFLGLEQLRANYSDIYIHTHISENEQDVKWSQELFNTESYLEIYDRYNLLSSKTLLAHGVYLTNKEEKRIHETGAAVAFCPMSNLFLGSGLFNLKQADQNQIKVALGTDIGAGTSFSMLQNLNDAYKVLQLQNQNLSALKGFYLATLGGAKALNLEDKLGNFQPQKEADFVVINIKGATPLLKRRIKFSSNLSDKLFTIMTLGDDRSIEATYINGKLAYSKNDLNAGEAD